MNKLKAKCYIQPEYYYGKENKIANEFPQLVANTLPIV